MPVPVVSTNRATCRDCYRCVRICPVKAIGIERGQAFVSESRCVACGTCIRHCPRGAKVFRDDLDAAVEILAGGGPTAASIAPSFAAIFTDWERKRLPSALRRLGFSHVAETSVGAHEAAVRTAEHARLVGDRGPSIAGACPALVNYIEIYRPDLIRHLAPVPSPMILHGRAIKQRLGEKARVIFIGPCIAKKAEADRPEYEGVIDCALTFVELAKWFEREGIDLSSCEESVFDEAPYGDARLFPLVGGLARTAKLETDHLSEAVVAVGGFEAVCEALDAVEEGREGAMLVEPLFCREGCVNGPAAGCLRAAGGRRGATLSYARESAAIAPASLDGPGGGDGVAVRHSARPPAGAEPSEEQIIRLLESTGKARQEDRLDCGACGYSSCRDKAVAVLQGMAELEMCIPRMKRLAEQRSDRIIEASPNGIVILNDRLEIVHMNPAFGRLFACSESICGKRVSYLMDPDPFERLAAGESGPVEQVVRHEGYGFTCQLLAYALPDASQYVGIFLDLTKGLADRRKLDDLRTQTVLQARELLEHQIRMSQQLGRYLGESAAKGETLVEKLLELARDPASGEDRKDDWLWDMYTSK